MLASTASRAIAQWYLVWLFAVFGGEKSVGTYALALAISSPIFVVAEGGLRTLIVTAKETPSYLPFLHLRMLGVVAAGSVSMAIGAAVDVPIATVMLPLVLLKATDSLLDIPLALFLSARRFTATALGGITNSLSTAILATTTSFALGSAKYILWSSFVASLIAATWYLIRAKGLVGWSGARPAFSRMSSLGLAAGVNSILVYCPVLYLSSAGDLGTVGVYAAASHAITLASVVLNATQQGVLPWLVAARSDSDRNSSREWRSAGRVFTAISLTMAAGIIAMLPALMPVVYPKSFAITYSDAVPFAAAILALAVIHYTSAGLYVANRYDVQLWSAGGGLLAVGIAALVMLPRTGVLVGATLALVGYASRAAISCAVLRRVRLQDQLRESV